MLEGKCWADCFINSLVGQDEIIWVGTSGGLYRFDRNKNQWQNYVGKYSLPTEPVTAVACYEKDVMVGTESGLLKYSPEEHASEGGRPGAGRRAGEASLPAFPLSEGGSTVLVSELGTNYINTILVSSGVIWVGLSGGVARYNSADDTWVTLTDGLPNNNVRALAAEDAHLWIGTPQGLARLDLKELKITDCSGVVPTTSKAFTFVMGPCG